MEQLYNHPYNRRPWIRGLALGSAIVLLAWPGTRWIVRTQVRDLICPTAEGVAFGFGVPPASLSTAPADDLQLQIAAACAAPRPATHGERDGRVDRLRALTSRFGDSPSLYATILRFATQSQIKVNRPDEELLVTGTPGDPNMDHAAAPSASSTDLAAFERDAADGERVDPDNGYFPIMRSVALFAEHRDDEALAALGRAADDRSWNEYYAEELHGEWRMREAAFGTQGAISRVATSAAILFPHLAQIRAAARVATALAIEKEQAGNVASGLAIRANILRCGSLMRINSPSGIGMLVGVAVSRAAIVRPGGAAAIKRPPASTAASLQAAAFTAYLRSSGHETELPAYERELAAGTQAREIMSKSLENSPFNTPLRSLIDAWLLDGGLLGAMLWTVVLGGAAALIARTRWARSGAALSRPVRQGAFFAFVAILGAAALFVWEHLPASGQGPAVWNGRIESDLFALFTCGTVLAGAGLARAATRAGRRAAFISFGASIGGISLIAAVIAWNQIASHIHLATIATLMDGGEGGSSAAFPGTLGTLASWLPLLIPGAILVGISLCSLVIRVPVSAGLLRGLRGLAAPAACLLVLCYTVALGVTLRYERQVDNGLTGTLQNEGRYLAEVSGLTWPK